MGYSLLCPSCVFGEIVTADRPLLSGQRPRNLGSTDTLENPLNKIKYFRDKHTTTTQQHATATSDKQDPSLFFPFPTPVLCIVLYLVHVKHPTCTEVKNLNFQFFTLYSYPIHHITLQTPQNTQQPPTTCTIIILPHSYPILYVFPVFASSSRLSGPSLILTGGGCNRPPSVTLYFIYFDHSLILSSSNMPLDVPEQGCRHRLSLV